MVLDFVWLGARELVSGMKACDLEFSNQTQGFDYGFGIVQKRIELQKIVQDVRVDQERSLAGLGGYVV